MKGCYTWDEVNGKAKEIPYSEVERYAAQLISMMYAICSILPGTTGFPKGVMLTHYNVVNND